MQSVSGSSHSNNTAVGYSSLESVTTGNQNTAIGSQSLESNTTGTNNVALGYQAGYSNTTGSDNVAIGVAALDANTTASNNVAVGQGALTASTTGYDNVAVGKDAAYSTTTGSINAVLGKQALYSNTTASYNVAVGYQAGYSYNGSLGSNTYIGHKSGHSSTGESNTFVGSRRISDGVSCAESMTTGSKNTIIGNFSGNNGGLDIRTASNYVVLSDGDGNPRFVFNGSGYPFIYNMSSGAGTNTLKFNTGTGEITYDTSSARYKDNIRDSVYGLSHVMQMRSAQFEYKDSGRSDVGLIAEEIDPIVPELVGKNKDGEPDSVSYDRMVSVLVKAIQELKTELDAAKAEIEALKGA